MGLSKAGVESLIHKRTLKALPGGPRANGIRLARAAVVALKKKRDEEVVARLAVPSHWKGVNALARINKTSRATMRRLLNQWVKDGLLICMHSYVERTGKDKKSKGRKKLKVYDPQEVNRLFTQRGKDEVHANGNGTPVTTAKISSPVRPQTEPSPKSQRDVGGRPRTGDTAAVLEFCYDHYITKGQTAATVLYLAAKKFGNDAPKDAAVVRIYAKRWATRVRPPLSMKRDSSRDC